MHWLLFFKRSRNAGAEEPLFAGRGGKSLSVRLIKYHLKKASLY